MEDFFAEDEIDKIGFGDGDVGVKVWVVLRCD